MYVDGEKVDVSGIGTIGDVGSIDSIEPLLIGKNRRLNMKFNGTIDDVRIYDRALNQEEIQFIFNQTYRTYGYLDDDLEFSNTTTTNNTILSFSLPLTESKTYNFTVVGNSGNLTSKTVFFTMDLGVIITDVYDELTGDSICYDVVAVNSSFTYNASDVCGYNFINYNDLPHGTNVKFTFLNDSYIQRDYYVTLNPTGDLGVISLTPYLLAETTGSYITVFVYSGDEPSGSTNALVSARRFLNSSWRTIDQKLTDTQGKAYFYLYPWTTYQVLASKGIYSALVESYYPNPSYILYIKLNGSTTSTNITWVFDTVSIRFTPTSRYISGITTFDYFITASENDLEYYFMNITAIDGNTSRYLYYNSVDDSPNGGEFEVAVNVTNQTELGLDRLEVEIGFKRSGYDEWNTTRYYLPSDWPDSNLTDKNIPYFMDKFKDGSLGITSEFGKYFIALVVSLGAGIGVGRYTTIGGAFVFIGVLSFFALFGFFSWFYIVFLFLIAIGFYLWRRNSL